MPSNQELNELVARKLGWTHGWGEYGYHERFPDYCTDIRAAWEIVESVDRKNKWFELTRLQDHWACSFENTSFRGDPDEWVARADTAPMAVCLAFLKLAP